jgi:Zn-dependent peptidase ImmA (M78 family)/DNA-binding XRE family transcriptional regulator
MLNPARLQLARKRRGLTIKSLASACDVSTRTVSAWETGAAEPKRESCERLAQVLDLPVAFFAREDPAELPAEQVSFRALSAMSARERDQALSAGVLAFELDGWLTSRFDGPSVDVPDLPGLDPGAAAQQVRSEWNLGDRPLGRVIPLLESRGIRVYSLVQGTRRLDAFSTCHDHVPYIFLNTEKSAERGRYDLAHELGHLVMHRGVETVRNRKFELEADRFAGAFLLPATGVFARVPRRVTLDHVMQDKHHWRVPAMAYVYRLHELQLLSDWHYRSYCIDLTQRGYRLEEPDGGTPESSLLLAKIFELLRQEKMTMRQVAAELALTEQEISQLVFGLVLAPIAGEATTRSTRRGNLTMVPPMLSSMT